MLNVTVVGTSDLIRRFQSMPNKVRAALVRKVTVLVVKLENLTKTKLSGQVLKVRTGRLRSSVRHRVEQSDIGVVGQVYVSGVPYARIHELGGKTRAHEIVARKGQALAFMMGGKQAFFKRVNHPGSRIPERSYMRSSLADMKNEISQGLADAAREGAKAR